MKLRQHLRLLKQRRFASRILYCWRFWGDVSGNDMHRPKPDHQRPVHASTLLDRRIIGDTPAHSGRGWASGCGAAPMTNEAMRATNEEAWVERRHASSLLSASCFAEGHEQLGGHSILASSVRILDRIGQGLCNSRPVSTVTRLDQPKANICHAITVGNSEIVGVVACFVGS